MLDFIAIMLDFIVIMLDFVEIVLDFIGIMPEGGRDQIKNGIMPDSF
jgi:hypothetical protein